MGVTFFICVNQTFATIFPTINVFPDQKGIIKRERAAGTYRAFSGYFSKFLSTLPVVYGGSLLLSIPIYWMLGFQADAAKYFIFMLVILIHAHTANTLGLAIGSIVPSARVGQAVAPLITVILLIFGGQFVNLDNIPPSLRWIQYISFISYSNKALVQNEFDGLNFKFPCIEDANKTCEMVGKNAVKTFGLENPSLWYCVLINVGLSLVFMIIGVIGFARTTAPLMRLSSDSPDKSEKKKKIASS